MTEAAHFYETAGPGLGYDFLDDVQHAIDSVRVHPQIGASLTAHFRRVLLRRFPFGIIYVIEQSGILVVAVAHQRRAPDYWKGRS